MERLSKINKNNKLKMAAAVILNLIYQSEVVYYCTHLHKIWHVYYVWGPTYTHAKILNEKYITKWRRPPF